jgi:hypothetical protein
MALLDNVENCYHSHLIGYKLLEYSLLFQYYYSYVFDDAPLSQNLTVVGAGR